MCCSARCTNSSKRLVLLAIFLTRLKRQGVLVLFISGEVKIFQQNVFVEMHEAEG